MRLSLVKTKLAPSVCVFAAAVCMASQPVDAQAEANPPVTFQAVKFVGAVGDAWQLECESLDGEVPTEIFQAYAMDYSSGGQRASWAGLRSDSLYVGVGLGDEIHRSDTLVPAGVAPIDFSELLEEDEASIHVVWASWGGAIRCIPYLNSRALTVDDRAVGTAHRFWVSDFNAGAGAVAGMASVGIQLSTSFVGSGYLFAHMRSGAGRIIAEGPYPWDRYEATGLTPWIGVAGDTSGTWTFRSDLSLSPVQGSSVLWIIELK